ncbi:hypothetical protein BRC81_17325 [Halobacteriales archaeon QS_1_68_20]|nr:MAG: hypothetical protein BRC81_17325 [Halobacteriales archaeon QS_1_68_20]
MRFERDTFGPDDREGLQVAFRRDDTFVDVLPAQYERESGTETVGALTEDWTGGRSDPGVPLTDVPAVTAFATRLTYTPFDSERQEIVCVAADAGDALAVGLWLAAAAEDARDLHRHVNRHAGLGSPTGPALSDDEILTACFAEEPIQCVYLATDADDHRIELPYRYAPLLSAARRTPAGVPRFPSTVQRLAGVVSREAWEKHDLGSVDLDAPLERDGPGEYQLPDPVADAVAGTDAESYALVRLGDEE